MGFLHTDDKQANICGSKPLKILGLASDDASTPTGMRDEILLLSWLVVLLRTQESGQVSFEWAYGNRGNAVEHEAVSQCLSTDVMTDLQGPVEQSVTAMSRYTKKITANDALSPVPILLSTSSLSRNSEKAKDDVSE